MTTVNVAILNDRIVVATDGLASGKKPQLMPKVMPAPHLSAVIAARGPVEITAHIPRLACEFATLPEMREGLLPLLKGKYGFLQRVFPGWTTFNVIIAGWHAGSPVAFVINSKCWTLDNIEEFCICPEVAADLPRIDSTIPRDIDRQITRSMGSLMQRQHEVWGDVGCGGFCQTTQIFPSGDILTRVIARF